MTHLRSWVKRYATPARSIQSLRRGAYKRFQSGTSNACSIKSACNAGLFARGLRAHPPFPGKPSGLEFQGNTVMHDPGGAACGRLLFIPLIFQARCHAENPWCRLIVHPDRLVGRCSFGVGRRLVGPYPQARCPCGGAYRQAVPHECPVPKGRANRSGCGTGPSPVHSRIDGRPRWHGRVSKNLRLSAVGARLIKRPMTRMDLYRPFLSGQSVGRPPGKNNTAIPSIIRYRLSTPLELFTSIQPSTKQCRFIIDNYPWRVSIWFPTAYESRILARTRPSPQHISFQRWSTPNAISSSLC